MNRNSKVMSIVAVAVCVVALSVGFAAFSNTLTISSGATVKPNASDFKVEFSTSKDSAVGGTINPSEGVGDAITLTKGSTTISGLKASLTGPEQDTRYTFYIHNTGKYDAFLKNVKNNYIEGTNVTKRCTTVSGKENPMLDDFCEAMRVTIYPTGEVYRKNSDGSVTNAGYGVFEVPFFGYDITDRDYSTDNFFLGTSEYNVMEMGISISYDYLDDGKTHLIDEDVIIEFGDIDLVFGSTRDTTLDGL